MISFTLSEQQQQLKEMTNWFAVNEIRPISLKADRLGYVPADWLDHINKMGIQLNTTSLQSKNDNASKKGKEEREGNRKIGRASCRERMEITVVSVRANKTTRTRPLSE